MFEYKAIVLKQSIPHDLFEKLKEEQLNLSNNKFGDIAFA